MAKHNNLSEKNIIKHCIDAEVNIFALILSRYLKKYMNNEEGIVEFIDNKYMVIPKLSLIDYIGLASGDDREPTIPYLYILNLNNVKYIPLSSDNQEIKYKYDQLKLYINESDFPKLNNHISKSIQLLSFEKTEVSNIKHEDIPINININKNVDIRLNIELQELADNLANEYMNKNNGKIPLKKTIAYQISKNYPKYGKPETIERRIKQTWKSKKIDKNRFIS